MADAGKLLVVAGGLILLVGIVFMLAGKVPLLGRLPGDISFRTGNTQVFIPIATSLLLSLLLTIVLNLFFRGR